MRSLNPGIMAARAFLVVAACLAAATASAQTLRERAIQLTRAAREESNLPGISAAVTIDGAIVWSGGAGYADLEHMVPATGETVYRIASISKPIAAVGLMQLVELGQVDLDAEIQTYVPFFPRKQWPVTVRQLLTHTSGIRHYNPGESGDMRNYPTIEDALGVFMNDPLRFEPGTRYAYSSFAYNIVAAIIESASGQGFGDYLAERVWGPAGMAQTGLEYKADIVPHRARPYTGRGGRFRNSRYDDVSVKWAGGGIIATAEDLVRFARAVQDGETLIELDTFMAMLHPTALADGTVSNYGLGFQTDPEGEFGFVFGHSGSSNGFRSRLFVYPEAGVAAAAITNLSGDGGAATRLARQLAEMAIER